MATQRVSPDKTTAKPTSEKKPRRKSKAAAGGNGATHPEDTATLNVLEPSQAASTEAARIDPERRRELVAAEAYFRAEKRGFTAGYELDDWIAAEAAVDSRVQRLRMA
jgi:hypothetical protein